MAIGVGVPLAKHLVLRLDGLTDIPAAGLMFFQIVLIAFDTRRELGGVLARVVAGPLDVPLIEPQEVALEPALNFRADRTLRMVREKLAGPLDLCFNAKDDNCNGLIDEGCGEEAGALQLVLAWSEKERALDLSVEDPNRIVVSKGARTGRSNLVFTRDCPEEGCGGQNVEVIFADEAAAVPAGRYRVKIHDGSGSAKARAGSATLGIRAFGEVLELRITLPPDASDSEVSFVVSSRS